MHHYLDLPEAKSIKPIVFLAQFHSELKCDQNYLFRISRQLGNGYKIYQSSNWAFESNAIFSFLTIKGDAYTECISNFS